MSEEYDFITLPDGRTGRVKKAPNVDSGPSSPPVKVPRPVEPEIVSQASEKPSKSNWWGSAYGLDD